MKIRTATCTVLVDAHPQMAPYVEQRAGAWIDRIAEQSILDNVGGVARELRERLAEGEQVSQQPPNRDTAPEAR